VVGQRRQCLGHAEQWADALVEWLGMTEDQMHVTNSKRDADLTGRRFSCLIASYNFLGSLERHDGDLDFKVVVMDEAHYIKNKKVRCRFLLTVCYSR
jgi:replicative superfamily II helicase